MPHDALPPNGRPVALGGADELALAERRKYMAMWERPEYHRYSPGKAHAPEAMARLGMKPGETLYDLGCGAGAAIPLFVAHGLLVRGVDIAMSPALAAYALETTKHLPKHRRPVMTGACLWTLPLDWPRRDWVFCVDVLEHVPPAKVDAVLMHIHRLAGKAAYLSIHCHPDGCGALIGETLHLTVERPEWWLAKLGGLFDVERIPAPASELTAIVRAKREVGSNAGRSFASPVSSSTGGAA